MREADAERAVGDNFAQRSGYGKGSWLAWPSIIWLRWRKGNVEVAFHKLEIGCEGAKEIVDRRRGEVA